MSNISFAEFKEKLTSGELTFAEFSQAQKDYDEAAKIFQQWFGKHVTVFGRESLRAQVNNNPDIRWSDFTPEKITVDKAIRFLTTVHSSPLWKNVGLWKKPISSTEDVPVSTPTPKKNNP